MVLSCWDYSMAPTIQAPVERGICRRQPLVFSFEDKFSEWMRWDRSLSIWDCLMAFLSKLGVVHEHPSMAAIDC